MKLMPRGLFVSCLLACLAPLGVTASTYEVITYGALCDGAADDTVAIQAAIDAAEASGGRVLFPSGTCLVGGPLTVDGASGVYLEGRGAGASVLKRMSGSYSGSTVMLTFSYMDDSGARGLTLDGNKSGVTGGSHTNLKLVYGSRLRFSELSLVDGAGNGLFVYGTEDVVFSTTDFRDITQDAVYLGHYWNDLRIVDSSFVGTGGRAIYHYAGGASSPSSGLIVARNTFDQSAGAEAMLATWSGGLTDALVTANVVRDGDLRFYRADGLTVSANQIDGAGIVFSYGLPGPVVVSGNTVENGGGYGLSVSGLSGATSDLFQISVVGNRFLSDHGGMKFSHGQNLLLSGNVVGPISAPVPGLGQGILVSANESMTGLLISDNTVEGMKSGIVVGPYSTKPANVDGVLISGNIIRSGVSGASGVSVIEGPNSAGGTTTNYSVEGNLEVFFTP